MTDLMRCYALRGIAFENMLDGPGRDVFTLLPDKERPDNTGTDEFRQFTECFLIDKNGPYFIAFSPYPDRMFVEINILDIDAAEF
jgi:hypothetical protein